MSLVHTYTLVAKDGEAEALASALFELGSALAGLPGAQGTRLLRSRSAPLSFLFLEFWDSEDARKAAGSDLPQPVMARIMSCLDGKPSVTGYDEVQGPDS